MPRSEGTQREVFRESQLLEEKKTRLSCIEASRSINRIHPRQVPDTSPDHTSTVTQSGTSDLEGQHLRRTHPTWHSLTVLSVFVDIDSFPLPLLLLLNLFCLSFPANRGFLFVPGGCLVLISLLSPSVPMCLEFIHSVDSTTESTLAPVPISSALTVSSLCLLSLSPSRSSPPIHPLLKPIQPN